jgi:MoxR-like ATPase
MSALEVVPALTAPALEHKPPSLLTCLGIFGLDNLTPVIVAALATEEPLLLIGPHGTGKSLLLTRVAEALGLVFRHYNASLVNFDDLVGFPLPGPDGSLGYAQTPATIWGAGAVIFDEISRCRPDIQNKLFPIVHERRVQGLLLEDLKYRWAAMNPPAAEDDDTGYIGSEPLDTALADRFAFVVEMPGWKSLSEAEQTAVILADPGEWDRSAAAGLTSLLGTARASAAVLQSTIGESVAVYVRTLMALLDQAGVELSPRRGGMLLRSILAVHAAALVIEPTSKPGDSALLALMNGLPQRAQGFSVPNTKVLAAHKQAWRLAAIKPGDPLRYILMASDPVERVRLAVAAHKIPKGEFSGIVADAVAQLPSGAREAVIVHVFETGAVGRLNAAVAEQIASTYRDVATPVEFSESVHGRSERFRTWQKIKDILSRLNPSQPRAHLAGNLLAAAYTREEISSEEDAEMTYQKWIETDTRLAGVAL